MCVTMTFNKGQRGRSISPCEIQKANLYQLLLKVIPPMIWELAVQGQEPWHTE